MVFLKSEPLNAKMNGWNVTAEAFAEKPASFHNLDS